MNDLPLMRTSYEHGELSAATAGNDPMQLMNRWLREAITYYADDPAAGEPNAMALATATSAGLPSVRMVLCKGIDAKRASFVWYTNVVGRKARELTENPLAAATFWWPGLQRQVRAVGAVVRVDGETARRYFASRPRESQLSAHASPHQSSPVASRAELEARQRAAAARFEGGDIPMPDDWGGFELVASELEFWQGRVGRLHDRILFTRTAPGAVPGATPELGVVVTDDVGTSWHRVRLEP